MVYIPAGLRVIHQSRIGETAVADEEEETAVEASLEEILAKRAEAAGEEEESSILEIERDEDKTETLTVKVLPQQANEFTCRNCFLVKHRSQLADKKKLICRDCA